MISLFHLRDNAIFLKNWRERMRFASVVSAVIIAVVVIVLILIEASINDHYTYRYEKVNGKVDAKNLYQNGIYVVHGQRYRSTKIPLPWLNEAIYNIAIFQGILLLFFGSLSSYRMAREERLSGTLDFHRSSPTPRSHQVIGLLIGGPVLEWVVFFGTLLFSGYLFSLASPHLAFFIFLKFYAALIVCAVFFHAFMILLALSQNHRRARIGPFLLIFIIYSMMTMIFTLQLSTFYHLSWAPAYEEFSAAVKGDSDWKLRDSYDEDFHDDYYHKNKFQLLYSFFGFRIPSLWLQLLVQLPLIGFFCRGIMRKISHPERPMLSKSQWILLTLFVLFLYVGAAFSVVVEGCRGYYCRSNYQIGEYTTIFLYYIMALGIMGTLESTPNALLFSKGIRRRKKLGQKYWDPLEDFSGNSVWLFVFCMVVTVCYLTFMYIMKVSLSVQTISLMIVLSQIIFFAAAFEFFNLSRHRQKKSIFWTGLGILWIVIPILGSILRKAGPDAIETYFYVHSPFTTPVWLPAYLKGNTSWSFSSSGLLSFALCINLSLAGFMILLAHVERARIRKEVL